jgi:hypothetical protein
MQFRDRLAWFLITAVALTAMLVGHACELWLESVHAFGDQQAHYRHVGQGVAAELAVLLLVAVVLGIARYLSVRAQQRSSASESFMPALHAIVEDGLARLRFRLIGIQLIALGATELIEQQASGYHGNLLASIAGPGHVSALAIHLAVGALFALVLYRFGQFVSVRSRVLVEAVIAFVRWASMLPSGCGRAVLPVVVSPSVFAQHLSLIALGLAKRPPPIASASIA